jgi:hypothetical protein
MNPIKVEQAGILSAEEKDFAKRQMMPERTLQVVEMELAELEALEKKLSALGYNTCSIFLARLNLLDEMECIETGQPYAPEIVEEEEIDPEEFARAEAADKRNCARRDREGGFGT